MISIIICSRSENIPEPLEKNIINTIGCEYELIVIDNSKNKHTIFEAYNLGIKKSQGKYLCFMHDDIAFNTKNWGTLIDEIFVGAPELGLLGVVGSKIKTQMPSGWNSHNLNFNYKNIIQHKKRKIIKDFRGFNSKSVEKVVAVDGVFMVSKKSIGISFRESFSGFHNYDISFSLDHIIGGHQVAVTNAILVEHFSSGYFNADWLKSTINTHAFYQQYLPLSVDSITVTKTHETRALKSFVKRCLLNNELKMACSYWRKLVAYNPVVLFHVQFHFLLLFRYYMFRQYIIKH